MSEDKFLKLVQRFTEKTKNGELELEETADPNVYLVSFPDSSVTIERKKARDEGYYVEVIIFDGNGQPVENFGSWSFQEYLLDKVNLLDNLFELIRSQVKNIDSTLDNLLAHLEK